MPKKNLRDQEERLRVLVMEGEYHENMLELLIRTYLDSVFLFCVHMLHGDRSEAEDVTQEVFEEVCRRLPQFRGESSLKTWIFAIARYRCLTEIAIRKRHKEITDEHSHDISLQIHQDFQKESRKSNIADLVLSSDDLIKVLQQLEPEERSLIALRFGIGKDQELSIEEIAQLTGMARATAYRRVRAALDQLRGILDEISSTV